ncbi:hypothetical protein GW17_00037568 [Ensete ventricosum]|nr:hypothetical protein GW17_00037568 [Ensete ventricosum]
MQSHHLLLLRVIARGRGKRRSGDGAFTDIKAVWSSKNTGQKGNAMRTRKRMRSQIESVSAYCNHFTRVDLLRSTIVDFSFPSENLMDAAALTKHTCILKTFVSPAADPHHGLAFFIPACFWHTCMQREERVLAMRGGEVVQSLFE